MGKYEPTELDRARDELFSHIQRCGVLEAEEDQRVEWFEDTIEYLAERYTELTPSDLAALREMGERYCSPAIPHGDTDARDMEDEADPEESTGVGNHEPSEVTVA